ncbi:hypothetical protein FBU59_007135, partial [Linderina macrospora]
MSLLRFANDTSPPGTEWVGIGWNDGSMSLQHRNDRKALIVMQISPPSPEYQVILGKTSELSEVRYRPTKGGPSQVFLESPVELDATLPYYFKVAAHHNLKDNRTTYEGLYSIGQSWVYMGSIILQHPTNGNKSTLSVLSSAFDDSSDAATQSSESAEASDARKSKAHESSSVSNSSTESATSPVSSPAESSSTVSSPPSSSSSSSVSKKSKLASSSTLNAEEASLGNEIDAQFSSARASDDHSDRRTESDKESDKDEDRDEDRDED